MTDLRVRPAREAEAGAVRHVARESWHAAYDDVLGADTVDDVVEEWYDPGRLQESIADEDQVFPVAVEAGAVAGFAHAGRPQDGETWHLFRIYVAPDRWGEGIGTRLLDRVERELADRGVDTYELAVLAANDVGVAFYESRGFERFDTRDVELGGVETVEHWYRKAL